MGQDGNFEPAIRIELALEDVGGNSRVEKRFPKIAQTYTDLGHYLSMFARELDHDGLLCGTSEPPEGFEEKFIEDLAAILGKSATVEVKTYKVSFEGVDQGE